MFKGRDILSILDFKRNEIEHIFEITNEMKKILEKGKSNILEGKILATAFFEPSTRTKLSFETAMQRLGGSVIGFSEPSTSSIAKGENISDTIRMLDSYADIIVIRHRLEGVAKLAAEIANSPVINGGDGTHNHPTQSIIDLYTIWDKFGKIDGLNICQKNK
jgi:aspartate carbamoyltransferase catalytic subunit